MDERFRNLRLTEIRTGLSGDEIRRMIERTGETYKLKYVEHGPRFVILWADEITQWANPADLLVFLVDDGRFFFFRIKKSIPPFQFYFVSGKNAEIIHQIEAAVDESERLLEMKRPHRPLAEVLRRK
ncbi:MAG: hypothetical protein JSS81_01530 [Acidobacteria bacterium]|nr:hypothetical protein [Acidobacteriota bacterium]